MNDPQIQTYDDEIELIDLFRVLWKWKILICVGTLLCGCFAFWYGVTAQKVYKVGMTVQPGLMYTAEDGAKRVLIDSINSIMGRIKAGIYDDPIIDQAIKPINEKPERIRLELKSPDNSDVLLVGYETSDPQEGAAVLTELFNLLRKQEDGLIKNIIEKLNRRISLEKIELEKRKNIEASYAINVQNIEKRINELQADIHAINENSGYLSDQRKRLLGRDADAEGALSVLLYSNTIQQNIQYINSVKKDLNEHRMMRERELQKVILEKNEQKKISEHIYTNEKIRDNIVKMSLIKAPTVGRHPIKPKKSVILGIALITGFLIMVFLSFIFEYLKNNPLVSMDESTPENG
jgi:LPS O-antigen subunit length determinant protein (WzzB/FepE family)